MRYLKKYESREYIDKICRSYHIFDYTINSDESVNVNHNVTITNYKYLVKFPLNFGYIDGYFDCTNNSLTTLQGSPESLKLGFYCSKNELTSLEGCPKHVRYFFCYANRLTSLVYCPEYVECDFYCNNNNIETFEGLDFIYIGGDFYCDENPIYNVWKLFWDHTKFEFFNDCDPIREDRVIILDRLNFFLDYINKPEVTMVEGYKCI